MTVEAARRSDSHLGVLLLSAPVLLTVYRYHGYADTFRAAFPSLGGAPSADLLSRFWQFGAVFVLLLVVPLAYARWGMKVRAADVGLGAGDWRWGLKVTAALLPVVVAVAWAGARMPDVRAEYPMARTLVADHAWLLWYEAAYVLLYYVAWESYFRGVLVFGVAPYLGAAPAILIQTISSCLIHIGKPEGEILGSIAAGVAFGWLAWRSRSIWYGVALHAALGVLTDLFVIFG
jgi:membrane protease YdiL (CAAX protease family)